MRKAILWVLFIITCAMLFSLLHANTAHSLSVAVPVVVAAVAVGYTIIKEYTGEDCP